MESRIALPDFRQLFNLSKMSSTLMSILSNDSNPSRQYRESSNSNSFECETSLQSVIQFEIIPRLLSSRKNIGFSSNLENKISLGLTQDEIEEFIELCIDKDIDKSQTFVHRLMHQGVSTEQIFLDLITPAARLLGQKWDEDKIDFTQVTYGLVQMHSIAHEIGFEYQDGPQERSEAKRILIASSPGSMHFLGPNIVANFFRKEGWQVVVEVSPSAKELVHAVANEWFDVIGISVSTQTQLESMRELVEMLKSGSLNPHAALMLGGPVFTIDTHLASKFSADAICVDAKIAVELASSILTKKA
jgi:methanogenic corrinoid protein MtbC1